MITVHTLRLDLNWELMSRVSHVDRFDGSWAAIEKREGQSLKQLKSIATVRSVGASTRIEGSRMSDEEVDVLLQALDISKLEDRDTQEVAGYFDVLELITGSYPAIEVSENAIKDLHKRLLKYTEKDEWHRGNFKQHPNHVEATLPDGSKQIIFNTTPPGQETEDAMRALIHWYHSDKKTHPLVKVSLFCYDFVSIHPFQDGNGRLSRLLSTLLLLQHNYVWIQYVSLEHEIENQKAAYYLTLRKCQAQRPGEDVTSWLFFFLDALMNIQDQLVKKLQIDGVESDLSPKAKSVLTFIAGHPGSKSGDIAAKLGIPNPTVKRMLANLVKQGLIQKFGSGPGTNYATT